MKIKRWIAGFVAACMVLTMVPLEPMEVQADVTYTKVYSGGSYGDVSLSSGSYLLENAYFSDISGPIFSSPGLVIQSGANVTLYISGNVTVKATDMVLNNMGGFAGIYVPEGVTLTIKKAPNAASATLNVYGGDGGVATKGGDAIKNEGGTGGYGGGGGGAAIGTYGADGFAGATKAAMCGEIYLEPDVTYNLYPGEGGAAAAGGAGAAAWADGSKGASGGGGGGGGGAGAPGAAVGKGGDAGGKGGDGGDGVSDDWTYWVELNGAGGGGGGRGYDPNYDDKNTRNEKQHGGGGGAGGALAAAQGGSIGGAGNVCQSGTAGGDVGAAGASHEDQTVLSYGALWYPTRTASGGYPGQGPTGYYCHDGGEGVNAGQDGSNVAVEAGKGYITWFFVDSITGNLIRKQMITENHGPDEFPKYPEGERCAFISWSSRYYKYTIVYTANYMNHSYGFKTGETETESSLIAYCENFGCDDPEGGSVTLPCETLFITYDGKEQDPAIVTDTLLDGIAKPTVEYYYRENIWDSYSKFDGYPVNVGYYQTRIYEPNSNHKVFIAQKFEIIKRDLQVSAKDHTIAYGETFDGDLTLVSADNLAPGDVITSVTYEASTNEVPGGTYCPTNVVIKNGDTDVTANYNITYKEANLTITPGNLTNQANNYYQRLQKFVIDKVNQNDKLELDEILSEIKTLLEQEGITIEDTEILEQGKQIVEKLLKQLQATQDSMHTENIEQVKDTSEENVKLDEKEQLEKAKEDLQKSLEQYGTNMTSEEKAEVEEDIDRIEKALQAIEEMQQETTKTDNENSSTEKTQQETTKTDNGNSSTEKTQQETSKTSNENSSNAGARQEAPKTADDNLMYIWLLLMMLGFGMICTLQRKEKSRKANTK